MHYLTAWGRWALELALCSALLPRGSQHWGLIAHGLVRRRTWGSLNPRLLRGSALRPH